MTDRPVIDVDVLIIGAGLSGIGAAARLTIDRPGTSYLILERRDTIGGTWDLFRYPGVRSDSDMFTLGYRFKPWRGDKALADGPSIKAYVEETARDHGVGEHIRFGQHVTRAEWSSANTRWTVTTASGDRFTARFLWSCAGYYDYDRGYTPDFPGIEDFAGEVIHPQHWPDDFDPDGRRIVVIGSGATAVTLVPALVEAGAGHVTMLQRSPSYILSMPAVDPLAGAIRRILPEQRAYAATRWKNVAGSIGLYQLARKRPTMIRNWIRKQTVALLPEGYDVDTHFKPRYDPWDERLCLVPDADLFKAIRSGSAEVVTDTIDRVTASGLRLASGREIEADVVVTATGLNLQLFGGAELVVDGEVLNAPERMGYKALMLDGVPNFFFTIGYTNASWTLKADLVAEWVMRLMDHLDAIDATYAVPVRPGGLGERPFMDFTPGYVLRAMAALPVQGDREPWRLRQNYFHDVRTLRRAPIDDGWLHFG